MENEQNEMDAYNVRATVRPRYFAFKVFGGWGAFGIVLAIAYRCYTARVADAKENTAKEAEIRRETRQESREDFTYILGVIADKEKELNNLKQKIDSIKTKL